VQPIDGSPTIYQTSAGQAWVHICTGIALSASLKGGTARVLLKLVTILKTRIVPRRSRVHGVALQSAISAHTPCAQRCATYTMAVRSAQCHLFLILCPDNRDAPFPSETSSFSDWGSRTGEAHTVRPLSYFCHSKILCKCAYQEDRSQAYTCRDSL
jgi:hypothetical protein